VTITRQIRRALIAWLALLSMIACTTSGVAPGPADAPTNSGRTVLVLWHAWPAPSSRALAASIERFNRANTGVQVLIQNRPATSLRDDLATAVAEGGGPHIALLPSHTLGALAESGVLLPAEGLLPAEELARLLPAALGAARVSQADGATLYGLPVSFDTLALYYNRANFTGAPPGDTTALFETARGLSNVGGDPPLWGLAYNLSLDRTIGYLYAFDGRVFDEQGQVALGLAGRAGTEAWLAWLADLRDDPRLLAGLDGVVIDSALTTRQAVMTIDWAHALATYSALWPGSLGVAPLPRLTPGNGIPRPYLQSEVLVLNARLGDQAERSAVGAVARHLVAEPTQRELLRAGRQPVLMSLDLNADDAALSTDLRTAAVAFRTQGARALPMPNSRVDNEIVWGILLDMHANAVRRVVSPAQAVENADANLRTRLAAP
jgi:ABC-type glycerol-3-phosphate transport system substrate-binding protein